MCTATVKSTKRFLYWGSIPRAGHAMASALRLGMKNDCKVRGGLSSAAALLPVPALPPPPPLVVVLVVLLLAAGGLVASSACERHFVSHG